MLLNAQATANLLMQNYEAAESLLVDALSKDPRDVDTLVNLITCHQHAGKPNKADVVKRYTTQLKREAPEHPVVVRSEAAGASFDRVAAGFGA